jgi:peptidase E
VDKICLLVKEYGWSDEAGSLIVCPTAACQKTFDECLPHFMAMQLVQQQIYKTDQAAGENFHSYLQWEHVDTYYHSLSLHRS